MRFVLSHALHSLRHPPPTGRFRARYTKKKLENDGCTGMAFDSDLRARLTELNGSIDQGFLTVPWLCDAIKLEVDTCFQVSNHLPSITCSEKQKLLLEANLEDTLALLDLCNGLKEVLIDVQHYVMLVRYAARSAMNMMDASDQEFATRLSHLDMALRKAAEFVQAEVEASAIHNEGRSKLDKCSSMLRRMGEPLPEVSPGSKRAALNSLFNDMYAAKVLAIFVCSVLAIALSIRPQRKLSGVHRKAQPTWLDILQQVQQTLTNLTDSGIQHRKFVLLKELDEVQMHTEELREMLGNFVSDGTPFADVDKEGLSQQCEKLLENSDSLGKGLLALQQNLDGLFRMVVTLRVDFLDALCPTYVS